ncbi:hypothetical protein [Actinokineospora sp.]|uniref:hypothetical protein n=1 Tax=Actinokineospora sp. TaxID=1872133 RepID=UPI004037DAC9
MSTALSTEFSAGLVVVPRIKDDRPSYFTSPPPVEDKPCPTYAWCQELTCVGSVSEDEHTGEFITLGQFEVHLNRNPFEEARVVINVHSASARSPYSNPIRERLTAEEAQILGTALLTRAAQLAAGPISERGAR